MWFSFPGGSKRKECTCNAGDPISIPGSERSAGEEMGYPLQYSWASPMAQLVKNSTAMWDTWVQSLGWENLLEKEMATHSSILAWRIPWTEEPDRLWLQRVRHNWVINSLLSYLIYVVCTVYIIFSFKIMQWVCPMLLKYLPQIYFTGYIFHNIVVVWLIKCASINGNWRFL